jgi:hypothetical protein
MNTARIFSAAVLVLLLLGSCDSHRNLKIESNAGAEVRDWGGNIVCASTPCVMRISRETCWFFDSSSGHIILTARSRAGVSLRSMAMETCGIANGALIKFVFPASSGDVDCAVIYYEGDREIFRTRCEDSLVKE